MAMDTFIEHDLRFHLALAKASGNMVMHSVIPGIQKLMRSSMLQVLRDTPMRHIAVNQHRAISRAICDGDVETAVGTMEEHLMKDVRFFHGQDGI